MRSLRPILDRNVPLRSALAVLASILALGLPAAAAADDFAVAQSGGAVLPSAETANAAGSLVLPPNWTASATNVQTLPFESLRALWEQAGAAYGIPWHVLAAINQIESNFGENMGPSSAGAVGWMQFMPDTWLRWGTDGDGDGVADPWNPYDGVYSASRYLAAAGARDDLARAIYAYNHADWYVDDVLDLASRFAGGVVPTPSLASLPGLEEAEDRVAALQEKLDGALARESELQHREDELAQRVEAAELLSDELALRKRAVALGSAFAAAGARVQELRGELAEAEGALESLRTSGVSSPFGLDATMPPLFDGSYVFPVGGGPGVVSTAHDHHDYPAADIAAPEGSPLWALTDGVVVRAWAWPEGRCGIGFTMRAWDGRSWTYCHLSYLDPAVTDGAQLEVGAPVGLVGSTGTRVTGPHLHLQLAPASSYPQAESWFQAYAGTAFSWQDGGMQQYPRADAGPQWQIEETASAGNVVLFSTDTP